jgi:hypothetical protein
VELQGRLEEIRKTGFGLAAISYDPVTVLADFATRRGISFPLLSDVGSRVIREYGILNTTVPPTNRDQYGIPFPGTFFVDRSGVVTSRVFEDAYQERDTIASVMVWLGHGFAAAGTRVTASHLELTTAVTDQVVAPGTHFAIVVDVKPEKSVHVYAPGVVGYKPITLRIDPQAGILVRSARFPQAEDFYFKPLNEHVPVYQKPFRIVQEIAIDGSAAGQRALAGRDRLTIAGTLDYQACDDKVCFIPQSVPLSWTVELKALDRERAKKP